MSDKQQEYVEVITIKPSPPAPPVTATPPVEPPHTESPPPGPDVYTQPVPQPQLKVETPEAAPAKPKKSIPTPEAYQERPRVKPFTRPLRVLHLTNVETANPYLNNLCDYTDRRAINYIAVTLAKEGGFTRELDRRGVQCYALNCRQRSRYPKALYQLLQIIQKERIDIVHTHLFEPTLLGLLAAKLRHCPVVVTRHHSDALYLVPNRFKRDIYLSLENWINRKADHLIAPAETVREILVRREHVPESKISVIPYGLTLERFAAIKPERIAGVRAELQMQERLALVCVARLHWEKGHRFLLEAFALLRDEGLDADLYCVGIGPDHELLENLVRELDLENNVRFLGWRDDAMVVMAAADIIVHPSLQEPLPAVVLEALLLERPLVVTDVSGVRDVIGNSKYGILIPPRNVEALHAALSWTVHNLDKARERAREGRKYILGYMSAERVALEYFHLYRRVLKDHFSQRAAKGPLSADTRQIIASSHERIEATANSGLATAGSGAGRVVSGALFSHSGGAQRRRAQFDPRRCITTSRCHHRTRWRRPMFPRAPSRRVIPSWLGPSDHRFRHPLCLGRQFRRSQATLSGLSRRGCR
jgi:glycosyltransferase involved in cell wall biosynthesis